MRAQTDQWSKMKTICQVVNTTERDGKETNEVRYYISSLPLGVKRMASATRNHWSIENSLHWVLNMTFNEDQSRIRKDHITENFGLLRRFAIRIIKMRVPCTLKKPFVNVAHCRTRFSIAWTFRVLRPMRKE